MKGLAAVVTRDAESVVAMEEAMTAVSYFQADFPLWTEM